MYEWIGKITGNHLLADRLSKLCGWIPRPVMLFLLKNIGILLYWAVGKKLRDKVLGNMQELLTCRREKELRRYRLHFFQNLVITLYELMLDSRRLKGVDAARFRVEGEERVEEALSLGRGAIVYAPHLGNFFYYYWYLSRKYNCLTIATAGSPELRPLYVHFQQMGCPGLDYDQTPPLELMRKLRKHLAGNGIVFILGDFYRPGFPLSQFFGKPTRTPEGAALLSIEQQVPIIPFHGYRESGFNHRLIFDQPFHLYGIYTKSQRKEVTRLLNRFMERAIRLQPAQWFYWFNAEERWEDEQEAAETIVSFHNAEQHRMGKEPQKTHSA